MCRSTVGQLQLQCFEPRHHEQLRHDRIFLIRTEGYNYALAELKRLLVSIQTHMKMKKDLVKKRLRPARIRAEKLVWASISVKMPSKKVQREQNATATNMRIQSA